MNNKLIKILWVIGFIIGLVAVGYRLIEGEKYVQYNNLVPWGLWVAVYIYFIGLSAGSFLFSTIVYVFNVKRFASIGKLALFTALATLLCALLSIWFDLGRQWRFANIFTSGAYTSMMWWMVNLYTLYMAVITVECWLVFREDIIRLSKSKSIFSFIAKFLTFGKTNLTEDRKAKDYKIVKLLATIGVPLAFAFHGNVGALFGTVGAREHWNSAIYPIMFLAGAFASGGALLTAIYTFYWKDKNELYKENVAILGKIVLALLLFDILIEWSEYSIALISHGSETVKMVLFGNYWYNFWILHVIIGVITPILLLTKYATTRNIGIGCLILAVSFISVRLNIVIPGMSIEELTGLSNAYTSSRFHLDYFPSLFEWAIALFIYTLFGIILYFGYTNLRISGEKKLTN